MELQTWELTDEQYKRLVAKSEELHALCRELHVPVIVAMQVGNDKNVFGHEGYSSFDLDRTCVNMLVFASVFDILLGAEAVTTEDMTKLMNTIHEIHHKYYGKHQNMEVTDADADSSTMMTKQGAKIIDAPDKCSKCGSEDIETCEPPLFESDDRISVVMQCQDCGHKWYEYFDLVEVVEVSNAE